jgi:4-hydroxy-tetrahydrodipicolinate reductase
MRHGEKAMKKRIRLVQMGLGPIGNKMTQVLAERTDLTMVGAIDTDPAKVGKDLGTLAGLPALGVPVSADMKKVLGGKDVDIVVLTTTSGLAPIYEQLRQLLPYGVSVVSSCEELCYPWLTNPAMAAKIDELAKKNKVAVLATGVNPGFLMDFLPIVMTGVCREVRKITVERIQDASFRRIPFQQKIGAGLTVAAFHEKVKAGTLRHVGLTESMHMIASCVGWKLDKADEAITPIIAERQVKTAGMVVEPGGVLGVQQIGRAIAGGQEVITMIFRAAIGEPGARDRIVIDGTPTIDTSIQGGVNGDVATCALLVNAIPAVLHARPGLRTMVDIEPPRFVRSSGLKMHAAR